MNLNSLILKVDESINTTNELVNFKSRCFY